MPSRAAEKVPARRKLVYRQIGAGLTLALEAERSAVPAGTLPFFFPQLPALKRWAIFGTLSAVTRERWTIFRRALVRACPAKGASDNICGNI